MVAVDKYMLKAGKEAVDTNSRVYRKPTNSTAQKLLYDFN